MPLHTQVVVIRSKTEDDAVVRLQSNAILRGLSQISDIPTLVISPFDSERMKALIPRAYILFHYDDRAASEAVKALALADTTHTLVCLGSDIYAFTEYLQVHDITRFYLAPTRFHRRVLLSQLYKPVYLLPESIDPLAVSGPAPAAFPLKNASRVMWFGYPESFEKGMASLVPVLKQQAENGSIDSFTLIVGTANFDNTYELPAIPYQKDTFAAEAISFDYCILSHLALDLSLNSYIKSPNKLITALALGLIPLVSRTPAYEELLTEFGLERFIFESPAELDHILRHLDPAADSELVRASGILQTIKERFSDANTARNFLNITADFEQSEDTFNLHVQPKTVRPPKVELHYMQHLRGFLPSCKRAFVAWKGRREGRSK